MGHWPQEESPDEVLGALTQFLQQLGRARGRRSRAPPDHDGGAVHYAPDIPVSIEALLAMIRTDSEELQSRKWGQR
ncbi:MAG: hypothetical protein L0271_22285 [Gemmatimonadetes bacterium]|nr:hypothetical protein [Gemmatimonadota bacterium]